MAYAEDPSLEALEEQVRLFARDPSEDHACLRYLATTSKVYERAVDNADEAQTQQWRSKLDFPHFVSALHEPTRMWRKAQVIAVNGDWLLLEYQGFGKQNARWRQRNSPLIQRMVPVHCLDDAWRDDLAPGGLCDLYVVEEELWVEAEVVDIIADSEVVLIRPRGMTDVRELPYTSPYLREYQSRTAPHARFRMQPRVFVSSATMKRNVAPFMYSLSKAFAEENGLLNCTAILKNNMTCGSFAFLLCEAFGNGLGIEAETKSKELTRELVQFLIKRIPVRLLRVSLATLEVIMRRSTAFTEQEITDVLEVATLDVAVDLAASLEDHERGHGFSLIARACAAVLKPSDDDEDEEAFQITRQSDYGLSSEILVRKIRPVLCQSVETEFTALMMIEVLPLVIPLVEDADDIVIECFVRYKKPEILDALNNIHGIQQALSKCNDFDLFLALITRLTILTAEASQAWWTCPAQTRDTLRTMKRVCAEQANFARLFEELYKLSLIPRLSFHFAEMTAELVRQCLSDLNDITLADYIARFAAGLDAHLKDTLLYRIRDREGPLDALCDLLFTVSGSNPISESDLDLIWASVESVSEDRYAIERLVARLVGRAFNAMERDLLANAAQHRQAILDFIQSRILPNLSECSLPLCLAIINMHLNQGNEAPERVEEIVDYALDAAFAENTVTKDMAELAKLVINKELSSRATRRIEAAIASGAKNERVILLLEMLLDEADSRGTSGYRAHASIRGGRDVQINVSFQAVADMPPNCDTFPLSARCVFAMKEGATVWDVKKRLSTSLSSSTPVTPLSLVLVIGGMPFGDGKENSQTVAEIVAKSSDLVISCHAFRIVMPIDDKEQLLSNRVPPRLSPKAEKVFRAIFKEFANNEMSLDAEGFCALSLRCSGKERDANSFKRLLQVRKCASPASMNCEEFLQFYADAAVKSEAVVWKDLTALGYDHRNLGLRLGHGPDGAPKQDRLTFDAEEGLRMQLEALAMTTPNADIVNPLSLRAELAATESVYDFLFSLLGYENEILMQDAWNLLMRLPSSPTLVRMLLEGADLAKSLSRFLDTEKKIMYLAELAEFLFHPSSTSPSSSFSGPTSASRRQFVLTVFIQIFVDKQKFGIQSPALLPIMRLISHMLTWPSARSPVSSLDSEVRKQALRACWMLAVSASRCHPVALDDLRFMEICGKTPDWLDKELVQMFFFSESCTNERSAIVEVLEGLLKCEGMSWLHNVLVDGICEYKPSNIRTIAIAGLVGQSLPQWRALQCVDAALESKVLPSVDQVLCLRECAGLEDACEPRRQRTQELLLHIWLMSADELASRSALECLQTQGGDAFARRLDDLLHWSLERDEDSAVLTTERQTPLLMGTNPSTVALLLQSYFMHQQCDARYTGADPGVRTILDFLQSSSRSKFVMGKTPPLKSILDLSDAQVCDLKASSTTYRESEMVTCDACGYHRNEVCQRQGPLRLVLTHTNLDDLLIRAQEDTRTLDECPACHLRGAIRKSIKFTDTDLPHVMIEFIPTAKNMRIRLPLVNFERTERSDDHTATLTPPDQKTISLFGTEWRISTVSYRSRRQNAFFACVRTNSHTNESMDAKEAPWQVFGCHVGSTQVTRVSDKQFIDTITGDPDVEIRTITLCKIRRCDQEKGMNDIPLPVQQDEAELRQFRRLRSMKVGAFLRYRMKKLVEHETNVQPQLRGVVRLLFYYVFNLATMECAVEESNWKATFKMWQELLEHDQLIATVKQVVDELLLPGDEVMHIMTTEKDATMLGGRFTQFLLSLDSFAMIERFFVSGRYFVCERVIREDASGRFALGLLHTHPNALQLLLTSRNSNPSEALALFARLISSPFGTSKEAKELETLVPGLAAMLIDCDDQSVRRDACRVWPLQSDLILSLIGEACVLDQPKERRELVLELLRSNFGPEDRYLCELYRRCCWDQMNPLLESPLAEKQRLEMILSVLSATLGRPGSLRLSPMGAQHDLATMFAEGGLEGIKATRGIVMVPLDAFRWGLVKAWIGVFDKFLPLQRAIVSKIIDSFFACEVEWAARLNTLVDMKHFVSDPFEVDFFKQLYAVRRTKQMRVLSGIAFLCDRMERSTQLLRAFAFLPVPDDEDRATDWIMRFLQRFPVDQPAETDSFPLAMECLRRWDKLEQRMDQLCGRTELRFPHECAKILVRVAMGKPVQVTESADVFVQVIDCCKSLLFWGTNGTRMKIILVLGFEVTGEEKFDLPDTENMVVQRVLLPGESGVLFEGERNAEDDEEEEDEDEEEDDDDGENEALFKPHRKKNWGRFSFTWQFFLIQDQKQECSPTRDQQVPVPALSIEGGSVICHPGDLQDDAAVEEAEGQDQLSQDTFDLDNEKELEDAEATRVASPDFTIGLPVGDDLDKSDDADTFQNPIFDDSPRASPKLPSVSFIEAKDDEDDDGQDDSINQLSRTFQKFQVALAEDGNAVNTQDDEEDEKENGTLSRTLTKFSLGSTASVEEEEPRDEGAEDDESDDASRTCTKFEISEIAPAANDDESPIPEETNLGEADASRTFNRFTTSVIQELGVREAGDEKDETTDQEEDADGEPDQTMVREPMIQRMRSSEFSFAHPGLADANAAFEQDLLDEGGNLSAIGPVASAFVTMVIQDDKEKVQRGESNTREAPFEFLRDASEDDDEQLATDAFDFGEGPGASSSLADDTENENYLTENSLMATDHRKKVSSGEWMEKSEDPFAV